MKVTLISSTFMPAYLCGQAAAVCTDSKNYYNALIHAIESGHTSVLEHAVFTFQIEGISRAALAQLTRHRIASFDVQSQRYVKINPENSLVIPESFQNLDDGLKCAALSCMELCMKVYNDLIDEGVPVEDARYVTPQAVPTKLIMTMNARELLHFFSLRTCNRAQWEIRELVIQMRNLVDENLRWMLVPKCQSGFLICNSPCNKKEEQKT